MMHRMKRFHSSKNAALDYIAGLGLRGHGLRAYKCKGGRYWVGSEFEWLNR